MMALFGNWRAKRLLQKCARVYAEEKNPARAASLARRASQLAVEPRLKKMLLVLYAEYTHRAGDATEAIKLYKHALDNGAGELPFTHKKLARLLINHDDLPGAIDHCLKSLRIDGPAQDTYGMLGDAHRHLGERDEAVKWYHKTLEVEPFDMHARQLLTELGDDPSTIPVFVDSQTRLAFPVQLGELRAVSKTDYSEKGSGYSIFYSDRHETFEAEATESETALIMKKMISKSASLYVFTQGERDIGDGRDGKHIARFLSESQAELRQAEQHGMYSEVQDLPASLLGLSTSVLEVFQVAVNRYQAQVRAPVELPGGHAALIKVPTLSFTLLTGFRSHALKIRCTGPEKDATNLTSALNHSVESILEMMAEAASE